MLNRLDSENFRNQRELHWRPGPGAQLLLGDNGAGKTSLLEAVYVLATTRSFRTPQLADCCRHGAGGFRLSGEIGGPGGRRQLALGWSGEGLWRTRNGSHTTLSEHLAVLPVVAWTRDDTELLTGGPATRRRFVDRGVVGLRPGALETRSRYRRALQQKRRLLGGGGRALEAWNEVLAREAAELARLRQAYIRQLQSELGGVLEQCELELPPVELAYRPSLPAALEGEEAARAALGRLAAQERQRGQVLAGPHRDELEISWGGRPARRIVSAGERKALGVALLAAQGRLLAAAGREPLYLLDDLDTELAGETLRRLMVVFRGAMQLLVSSNRPAVWETQALAQKWWLEGGCVRPG